MEDNKECEETDEGTGKVGEENKINTKNNNMEVKEQEMPSDESEYNYSEDFEVQFRIPGLQNVLIPFSFRNTLFLLSLYQ